MTQREYAIAGKVGGKELIKYPELFTDPWGDEIDFNEEKAESENSENLENPQD
jgi:hypothetical protein